MRAAVWARWWPAVWLEAHACSEPCDSEPCTLNCRAAGPILRAGRAVPGAQVAGARPQPLGLAATPGLCPRAPHLLSTQPTSTPQGSAMACLPLRTSLPGSPESPWASSPCARPPAPQSLSAIPLSVE